MAITDIDGSTRTGDVDERLSTLSGSSLLRDDLRARLLESPGGLYYDKSYGAGLGDLLNETLDDRQVEALRKRCEVQCLKDDRVYTASVSVSFDEGSETVTWSVSGETYDGEQFSFTVGNADLSTSTIERA